MFLDLSVMIINVIAVFGGTLLRFTSNCSSRLVWHSYLIQPNEPTPISTDS